MSAPAAAAASSSSCAPTEPQAKRARRVAPTKHAPPAVESVAFQPHTTMASLYPDGAVSRCPCLLSRSSQILVVGDGDLSYAVGLVRHLCGHDHIEGTGEGGGFDNTPLHAAASSAAAATAAESSSSSAASSSALLPLSSPSFPPQSLQLTVSTLDVFSGSDDRYAAARDNAAWLGQQGVRVIQGLDATKLHERSLEEMLPHATLRALEALKSSAAAPPSSALPRFHHILFHFPHVGGKSRIHLNRELVGKFLRSAREVLVRPGDARLDAESPSLPSLEDNHGLVHVSLVRGQGGSPLDTVRRPLYGDHWQLLSLASQAGMVLSHVFPFASALYSGYGSRGFRGRDEGFLERRGEGLTHILLPAERAQPQSQVALVQRNPLDDPAHPLAQVRGFLYSSYRASMDALPSQVQFVDHRCECTDTLNSVQWNLDRVESVSGDVANQVVQPWCVRPRAASSSVESKEDAAEEECVPWMHSSDSGVALSHTLTITHSDDASAVSSETVELGSDLRSQAAEKVLGVAKLMFGNDAAAITWRPHSESHGDVRVRHIGVWHVVGLLRIDQVGAQIKSECRWSLDKVAMLRFGIADVRWLWSEDSRFIRQFQEERQASAPLEAADSQRRWHQFVPFSLHPLHYIRDDSFWLRGADAATTVASSSSAEIAPPLSADEVARIYLQLVFDLIGPSSVCSVAMTDRFTHPTRGEAMRFRCVYNSVDRALSPEDVLAMQQKLHAELVRRTGVEMR